MQGSEMSESQQWGAKRCIDEMSGAVRMGMPTGEVGTTWLRSYVACL